MVPDNLVYVVRCVPQRMIHVLEVKKQIPELIVYQDRDGNAMYSFIKALRLIGERPAVLMEDDIKLTSNFKSKAEAVIAEHPGTIISFFTLARKITHSEWRGGSRFSSNLCTYFPPGYAVQIADYYDEWTRKEEHPTGYDLMIADWLKSRKERYYLHQPSLVQHLHLVSAIDRRRSKYRKAVNFEE